MTFLIFSRIEAAVGLELALAGTAGADPAAGARQVGPQPRQPRQVVLERGQLDLQPALLRLRVAGEDVDDQRRSVEHLAVEQRLEAALLVRRQLVVDDEQVEVGGRLLVDQLGRAALAEVPHRIGLGTALGGAAHDGRPGRLGQGGELGQRALHRPPTITGIVEADEEGALDRGGEVDHACAFGHLFDSMVADAGPGRPRPTRRTAPEPSGRYEGPTAMAAAGCHTSHVTSTRGHTQEEGVDFREPSAPRVAATTGGLTRRLLAGVVLAVLAFAALHQLMAALFAVDEVTAIVVASGGAIAVATVALLRTIAPLVATQADLQVRYEAALADALRDPLTRLGNHRAFQEELDRQVAAALRYELPLALLLIDLDEFKAVNDGRGHAGGDRVLRGFGQLAERLAPRRPTAPSASGATSSRCSCRTPISRARESSRAGS